MKDKIVAILVLEKREKRMDIEFSLELTVDELLEGLNAAYGLGLEQRDRTDWYIKCENPLVLLKGTGQLKDYGLRDGTILYA